MKPQRFPLVFLLVAALVTIPSLGCGGTGRNGGGMGDSAGVDTTPAARPDTAGPDTTGGSMTDSAGPDTTTAMGR